MQFKGGEPDSDSVAPKMVKKTYAEALQKELYSFDIQEIENTRMHGKNMMKVGDSGADLVNKYTSGCLCEFLLDDKKHQLAENKASVLPSCQLTMLYRT